jgi:hypothetical protein
MLISTCMSTVRIPPTADQYFAPSRSRLDIGTVAKTERGANPILIQNGYIAAAWA